MDFTHIAQYMGDFRFILFVLMGSLSGLFVGSIPGLSVTMATAILVSITYTWATSDALGLIMGLYVVGVYSGALSAILINIPGAPSSVVTTFDGHPMAKKGEAHRALKFATVYSFVGSVFGLVMLFLLGKPISVLAIKFQPMDYFLLAAFGLSAVGSLTGESFTKGMVSVLAGLFLSMIGLDSVLGTPRLTMGIWNLQSGIPIVPALVGLFGFSEVLTVIREGDVHAQISNVKKVSIKFQELSRHFLHSLYYSTIGTLVGALPGAGGPVASFLAYSEAKRIVKSPSVPFGEGAEEGIVASEASNNACIGGALIPMLTLAVPGDAVTAIILSVFYVHGLQPGPMFIQTQPELFSVILAGGFIGAVALLLIGLFVAPHMAKVISVPKNILLPAVTVLCIIGAYAYNTRMFDVLLMMLFGVAGYFMRRHGYSVAPLTLALVLGKMMDDNFRRAVSLAVSEDNMLRALFGRPITITLLILTVITILMNFPFWKRWVKRS
ncbi:MAG: tripartite tricarboxylate transporter permease [Sphaerochaetaceae bacterium]|nr:tripartite tricarboxylate transporter permease [Sphaerochaetaceae bacterium]